MNRLSIKKFGSAQRCMRTRTARYARLDPAVPKGPLQMNPLLNEGRSSLRDAVAVDPTSTSTSTSTSSSSSSSSSSSTSTLTSTLHLYKLYKRSTATRQQFNSCAACEHVRLATLAWTLLSRRDHSRWIPCWTRTVRPCGTRLLSILLHLHLQLYNSTTLQLY